MRTVCAAASMLLMLDAAWAAPLTYVNERFGTTATFPDEVFVAPQPPPANGDGATWLAADGASIAIYGSRNVLGQTPRGIVAEAKQRRQAGYELTYSSAGRDWAVLSGMEDGFVFYQRLQFGANDVIHALHISYPPEARAIYDPLVGPIAKSLSGP